MTTTRTAPTQAMAEILGLPYEAPTHTLSWLTSEAVIRNGGIRPPGTEHMSASKGTSKPKTTVKKDTSFTGGNRQTPSPVRTDKPITQDRVISTGVYAYGDTKARVKISQTSRKPYALVLNLETKEWEYTPGVVKLLKASDKLEEIQAPKAPAVTPGFYGHVGTVAEVVKSSAGRLYAKVLNRDTWRFDYAPGVVTKLKPEDRLTLSQAAALGKEWHHCGICGRELTNQDSIDRGIGPICANKL
jgi:hypothetical protein